MVCPFLPGEGKEMLWVFPNSAPRLRNPLWPLIFGIRLVRPTLTQPAAFGMRGLWLHIPLVPISALCYGLINKSCFFSPSFLSFCVLFNSGSFCSQYEELEVGETEVRDLCFCWILS